MPRNRRPLSLISEFLRLEAAAGLLLMAAAAMALILANSPATAIYRKALSAELGLPGLSLSLSHWINDGLMALFFLLVGLEIKRELLTGELSSRKRALLPGIAALGGVAVPSVIYAAFNWSDPESLRGWAIPAATDIAFALGIIAILGARIPKSLKIFISALAIIDDLVAILIIALFYTAHVSMAALALVAVCWVLLVTLNLSGVRRLAPYLLIGLCMWGAVLASGIHATLAGVALALTIPLRGEGVEAEDSPLHRLEHGLHPWVAYGVVPIFGLANAGMSFGQLTVGDLRAPATLGIFAGLFVGKQVGVAGAAWLAVKCGWAEWPEGASLVQTYGVALLCGIGFTMSLFIGDLAFASVELQNVMRLGVFAGSLLSGVAGFLMLRFARATPAR
jgi:NhaA family Na+:H+ antiporter